MSVCSPALFVVAKTWNWSKHPSANEWIKKMRCLDAVDFDSSVKNCDRTAKLNRRSLVTVSKEIRQTQTNFIFLLCTGSRGVCVCFR